jgi:hypothetical protein
VAPSAKKAILKVLFNTLYKIVGDRYPNDQRVQSGECSNVTTDATGLFVFIQ